jgi:molybdopterin molybdotransferase
MKTIVVSGARSDVGKTALAIKICDLLPGAVHVKIGHGPRKEDKANLFFEHGTPFESIARRIGDASFLVVESNSILSEIDPQCAIYLPADNPKESAGLARNKADIVRGVETTGEDADRIAGALGVSREIMDRIIELAGNDPGGKISFATALETVRGEARTLGEETIPLADALHRVLCDDVVSDIDMPPFDKSAMDGFACRAADLGGPLKIIGTVRAGRLPEKSVSEGECMRIMTGAAVPGGADTVVMKEETVETGGTVTVRQGARTGNICLRGEDVSAGDTVLTAGTLITPAVSAVLAASGSDPVPVFRRPVLGVLATGDELVEPNESPAGGMIRSSNGAQLVAQAKRAGFPVVYLGIAGDNPKEIRDTIERGTGDVNVYVISGGVSVGDYDHVPAVLEEAGFEILIRKVAMKPGMPLVFGRREDAWVFGLPGNPVSVFVLFEIFVKDFCFRLEGHDYEPDIRMCTLGRPFTRKNAERLSHIPVIVTEEGKANLIEYHGSAHINAYSSADGIMRVPAGVDRIDAGERIQVVMIGKP